MQENEQGAEGTTLILKFNNQL